MSLNLICVGCQVAVDAFVSHVMINLLQVCENQVKQVHIVNAATMNDPRSKIIAEDKEQTQTRVTPPNDNPDVHLGLYDQPK